MPTVALVPKWVGLGWVSGWEVGRLVAELGATGPGRDSDDGAETPEQPPAAPSYYLRRPVTADLVVTTFVTQFLWFVTGFQGFVTQIQPSQFLQIW